MQELLEAGVHFGHQTKRWNPKMKEFIFGERNGIYIIDLGKTVKLFRQAEEFLNTLAAEGKTVLFVGTKRQAQDAVAEEAQRCQMIFVNQPPNRPKCRGFTMPSSRDPKPISSDFVTATISAVWGSR